MQSAEELDSETEIEYEDNTYETRSKSSAHDVDEYPDINGISNTRDAYRLVSEEEKAKIAAQVETFRTEKHRFDREVAKWDDTGNDIIVIAKQMCMIMMEMTDFTRYVSRASVRQTQIGCLRCNAFAIGALLALSAVLRSDETRIW